MATPYLNKALTNFRREINERWPNRDKRSDGWIGDTAHQATQSDHNPDPDGSVDAIDIDVDGIDVQLTLAAAIHHEATWYVIYNRRITSRTMSGGLGVWHTYYGSSPHTEHIHVSSRQTHENSTKPWFAPLVQEVKELTCQVDAFTKNAVAYTDGRILAMATGTDKVRSDLKGGDSDVWIVQELKRISARLAAIEAKLGQ